jgi:hypothetical protein
MVRRRPKGFNEIGDAIKINQFGAAMGCQMALRPIAEGLGLNERGLSLPPLKTKVDKDEKYSNNSDTSYLAVSLCPNPNIKSSKKDSGKLDGDNLVHNRRFQDGRQGGQP